MYDSLTQLAKKRWSIEFKTDILSKVFKIVKINKKNINPTMWWVTNFEVKTLSNIGIKFDILTEIQVTYLSLHYFRTLKIVLTIEVGNLNFFEIVKFGDPKCTFSKYFLKNFIARIFLGHKFQYST